jgi:hypothetical protein
MKVGIASRTLNGDIIELEAIVTAARLYVGDFIRNEISKKTPIDRIISKLSMRLNISCEDTVTLCHVVYPKWSSKLLR